LVILLILGCVVMLKLKGIYENEKNKHYSWYGENRSNRRGQSAVETVTLVGLIFLFSIPLITLLNSLSDSDLAVEQAYNSAQMMTDAANSVFIMGCSSNKEILVPFPSKLRNVSIHGREVIFTIDKGYGLVDVSSVSIAPLDNTSDLIAGRASSHWVHAGIQLINVYCNADGEIRFELKE